MPEGDPVWHTAETLGQALVGRTLTRCDVRVSRFATADLTGQVVDEVYSRGKHLFIRVGPASIHSHLKMDGSWGVTSRAIRNDHRIRIILEADDIRAVGIDLGVLEILDRAHDGDAVAHLGPDLLGTDWDQLVVFSGLLPGAPVCAASDPHRLVSRARDMLWANRYRWNRCTTGDTRAGRQLWVYGRAGQSCRRCGTRIDYDDSGERVTYWCPACQR